MNTDEEFISVVIHKSSLDAFYNLLQVIVDKEGSGLAKDIRNLVSAGLGDRGVKIEGAEKFLKYYYHVLSLPARQQKQAQDEMTLEARREIAQTVTYSINTLAELTDTKRVANGEEMEINISASPTSFEFERLEVCASTWFDGQYVSASYDVGNTLDPHTHQLLINYTIQQVIKNIEEMYNE